MCKQCDRIDAKIARYRRVLGDDNDASVIIVIDAFISDLESEKTGLHPEHK